MRLTAAQLVPLGEDGQLIHFIDTAFFTHQPERVGVAVSGGGDSMALLHASMLWSQMSGVPVEAVTVDHGLRAEAANEAAMVAQWCATHGVQHSVLKWDGASAQGNIAAAGRDARYRLIADWAVARGIGGLLVGHTQDDVAETFLMRLGRKAGVDGLALMDTQFEKHGVHWARPFWQQSRADLRDYLRRHTVPWVEDPTNEDETHDRPKARKALAHLEPLGVTADGLADVALNMLSARTALEHYALQEARRLARFEGGDIVLPRRPRPLIPDDIKRRLWLAALQSISGAAYAPRQSALVALDAGLVLAGKHTLGGCVVTQSDTEIRFAREPAACGGPVVFAAKDDAALWDGRWQIVRQAGCPASGDVTVRALGTAVNDVPDWPATGLSKATLRMTPAVFDADVLVAAPVAGLQNGFDARIVADFSTFLLSR